MNFDAEKFYLGSLCKRSHDYEGTGKSLRYKSRNDCVKCHRITTKKWCIKNKEHIAIRAKKWAIKNSECLCLSAKKWYKKNKKHACSKSKKAAQTSVSFDSWGHRLVIDDKPQKDPDGKLSVVCAYCGKRFCPTLSSVNSRSRSLEGKTAGELRFYCDDSCKTACPVYHRQKYFKGQKDTIGTSYEVPAWLRQLAFERDNWTCQKCGAGKEATLHAHHIKPKAEFPSEAVDLENIITVCKNCHNEVHHLPGCGYGEIGRCK